MPYRVQLQNFEGPLDLLLFLIKKNEVEIYDIPVADITQQYLACLLLLLLFNTAKVWFLYYFPAL